MYCACAYLTLLFLYYRKEYCVSEFRLAGDFAKNLTNMWWEVLPSTIMVGMVPVLPQIIVYYMNQFVFGNPMRRNLSQVWDRNMFTRDCRIDGAPWKNRGLENIPDD